MPSDPAPSYTPFLGLAKPPDDSDNWGSDYRAAMDTLDSFAAATSAAAEPQRTMFEWGTVAGESVPLYIGSAPPGTATAAAGWTIKKFTWVVGTLSEASLVAIDVADGTWDGRVGLF